MPPFIISQSRHRRTYNESVRYVLNGSRKPNKNPIRWLNLVMQDHPKVHGQARYIWLKRKMANRDQAPPTNRSRSLPSISSTRLLSNASGKTHRFLNRSTPCVPPHCQNLSNHLVRFLRICQHGQSFEGFIKDVLSNLDFAS